MPLPVEGFYGGSLPMRLVADHNSKKRHRKDKLALERFGGIHIVNRDSSFGREE
jgi:hypothetical protein